MGRPNITGLWIEHVGLKHNSDDCLIWPFCKERKGYGRLWHEGKMVGAHRYILHLVSGKEMDNPLDAMHSCHHTSCVNPRHLSWGSRTENMHDKLDNGTFGIKLTPEQALEIFHAEGFHYKIADKFGVSYHVVSKIKSGHYWSAVTKHVASPRKPRLSKETVLKIYNAEGFQREIAKMFNTSITTVAEIRSGKRYSKITGHIREPKKRVIL